jgi:hypothetical protein
MAQIKKHSMQLAAKPIPPPSQKGREARKMGKDNVAAAMQIRR